MLLCKRKETRARTTSRGNEATRLVKTSASLNSSRSLADIKRDSATESKCLMVLFDRGEKKRCRTDQREKLVSSTGGVVCKFMRVYVGVRRTAVVGYKLKGLWGYLLKLWNILNASPQSFRECHNSRPGVVTA